MFSESDIRVNRWVMRAMIVGGPPVVKGNECNCLNEGAVKPACKQFHAYGEYGFCSHCGHDRKCHQAERRLNK